MDPVLKVLLIWSITTGVALVIMLSIVWPMAPLVVRDLVIMHWTRPSEVPRAHPLLEVTDRQVRYLGGEQYPLPKKFAWFSGAWQIGLPPPAWWIAFLPPFCLFMAMNSYVPSLWIRIVVMLAVQAGLTCSMFLVFRRLQPQWLNEHLASLPSDVRRPAVAADRAPA